MNDTSDPDDRDDTDDTADLSVLDDTDDTDDTPDDGVPAKAPNDVITAKVAITPSEIMMASAAAEERDRTDGR
jgi:hypothetical protein